MTRERVAGGGSSIVAPKPVRNASSVRIVPSIQSDAISLIADIFAVLHRVCAGPSRPYRELVHAGSLGVSVAVRFAGGSLFDCARADDRFADRAVKVAGEVVLRVAIGD